MKIFNSTWYRLLVNELSGKIPVVCDVLYCVTTHDMPVGFRYSSLYISISKIKDNKAYFNIRLYIVNRPKIKDDLQFDINNYFIIEDL